MINAKFLFFASNSSRETFLCGTVFFASLERTMVVEVFFCTADSLSFLSCHTILTTIFHQDASFDTIQILA